MSTIHFFYEGVKFRLVNSRATKSWIRKVFDSEKKRLAELNYIFCSDSCLAKINLQYLNHATYTDIITFDNTEDGLAIQGDIYISIQRVKENSTRFKTLFDEELHRVIVHGALHLIGYSDKSIKQKRVMRKKEDACLSLRSI